MTPTRDSLTLRTTFPPTALALFRYAVISAVRGRVLRGQLRPGAIHKTAAEFHVGPDGEARRVSVRSIYRWLAAYEARGLAGLENEPRTTATDGVLEPALITFLIDAKSADPKASIPDLLRLAVVQGLLDDVQQVDRTTVWRNLRRRGVSTARAANNGDQRRFAKAHRMQLVLCDGKHFRAGPRRAKRVALFFIDDATRYVPLVSVVPSESAEAFLLALHRQLMLLGRFDALYVDRGPGFKALDVRAVVASLGIAHILGRARYPPGRGKIERFNRTVNADVLRHLAREDVDPDCGALTLRIEHYLRHDYNLRRHEAVGRPPHQAFLEDERKLEPYDEAQLNSHFWVTETRQVSNDHVVKLGGDWEVPRGLAGTSLDIRRFLLEPEHYCIDHEGRRLRLQRVDLQRNADGRRGRPQPGPADRSTTKGAALTAADQAMAPITNPDGGFVVPKEN